MKTLIFQGSPRKHGETAQMVEWIAERLPGEVHVVDLYHEAIRPCIDCRYCFEKEGCAINDAMQPLYREIEECDHILIASPIYFEELTGVMLSALSRLQTYFSARYVRKVEPIPKKKTGGIILAAGSIGPKEKPEGTARMLLGTMGCKSLGTVYAGHTDRIPALSQEDVLKEMEELVLALKNSEGGNEA